MKALLAVFSAAAVLSLSAPPAHAQSAFREIMEDLGLQKRKDAKMDFSERAPLVIPPSTDMLPPPEQAGSLAAANPNWPHDPDDAKELEEAEKEKLPQWQRRKYQENAAKAIYKTRAQDREQSAAVEAPKSYDTTFDRNTVMTPEQLKEAQKKRAEAPAVNVYVEPERKRLTDPPPGYRTPSAAQPYGPGDGKKAKGGSWWNPFD
jgi:hypothetical protein